MPAPTPITDEAAYKSRMNFGKPDGWEVARSLERQLAACREALRELSDATLAAARVFNAMGKGDGCDLTDWARARQKMHDARLKANAALQGDKHGA